MILRQAFAGLPWKETCAGVMELNKITVQEVLDEVKRRNSMVSRPSAAIHRNPSDAAAHLVNLAQQLLADSIDDFTFNTILVDIFPDDHTGDILRRLVEALATRKLSGDAFRRAFDAVTTSPLRRH